MLKQILKNKKGDVPIVLLVIGVLAVCGLAILSFSFVIFTLDSSYYGISSMENVNSLIGQYNMYKNLGMSDEQIGEMLVLNVSERGEKYIYAKETAKASSFQPTKVMFSVKYYVP